MAATAVTPVCFVARARVSKRGVNSFAHSACRPTLDTKSISFRGSQLNTRVPHGRGGRHRNLAAPRCASSDELIVSDDGMHVVAVVTTKARPHCRRATAALRDANIGFEVIDASDPDGKVRDAACNISNMKTVPQVFVGGVCVGGADDAVAQLNNGTLLDKINDAVTKKLAAIPEELQSAIDAVERREDNNTSSSDGVIVTQQNSQNDSELYARLDHAVSCMAQDLLPTNKITFGGWRNPVRVERRVVRQGEIEKWIAGDETVLRFFDVKNPADPSLIAEIANYMVDYGLIAHVDAKQIFESDASTTDTNLFRLADHASAPSIYPDTNKPIAALNARRRWRKGTRDARVVALDLRERILSLYDEFLSDDGTYVDYAAMKQSTKFAEYEAATEELQTVSLLSLTRSEKIAFFVNLYNALVVHVTVVAGPSVNVWDRLTYFDRHAYQIGGSNYTCDDMEHGCLRGNKPGAASVGAIVGMPSLSRGPFDSIKDPRRVNSIVPPDPRIHFALVCGAKSCPPIRVYDGENLETQLALAAAAFVESETLIDKSESDDGKTKHPVVTTSKIIGEWYKWDFGGGSQTRIESMARYAGEDSKLGQDLLHAAADANVELNTNEYDWDLNGK